MPTVFGCILLSLTPIPGRASLLFWSGDGSTFGGAGTWDTTNARWGTSTSGPFTTVWNNANTDDATIGSGAETGGSIIIPGTITNNGTLTLNAAAGTTAYTLDGAGTMVHTVGSSISVPSGITRSLNSRYAGTITKTGAGTVTFNNSQGSVTKFIMKQGTAYYASPNRFGSGPDAADFFTFDGGILRMMTTTAWTMGRSITLTANSGTLNKSSATITTTLDKAIHGTSGGKINLDTGIYILSNTGNDWDGRLEIAASTTVQCGASGVVPSTCIVTQIAAGGNLNLNGFDQTIKSANGAAGSFVCGANTLAINSPNGETNAAVFTATAGGKVIKNGTGMLALTGNSTGFGGEFVVNDGTIGYGSSGALGANTTAGTITLNGGKLSNTSTGGRSVPATVAVNLAGDFTVDDSLFASPGQILFQGTNTIKNSNRTLTVNGAANLGISWAAEDVPGRSLTKAGSGILALLGTNTYTGGFTLNSGQVNVNGTVQDPFGTAGTLMLNGGIINNTGDRGTSYYNILNSITLAGDVLFQATTTTGTRNFTLGGPWTTSSGSLTISNASVAAGPATFDVRFTNAFTFTQPIIFATAAAANTVNLDIWNLASLGDQTYTGLISGPGSIKRSATTANTGGKVTFTRQNTFSGGTILNDGEIALGSDCAGPSDAPTAGPIGSGFLSISNDAGKLSADSASRILANHVVFSSGGRHLTFLGANNLELSGNIDLAAQNITFTNLNSGLAKLSGALSNGGLVKYGAGTLTLAGANTYAGNTTVGDGTLAVLGSSTVNAGPTAQVTVAAGATLDLTGKSDGTLTVGSGQTLAGGGTVLGAVLLDGTESPGASPGTLSSGPQKWDGGSHYAWQINNATNAAGADPGWDLIHVSSGINFFSSITNKFNIDVSSLAAANTNGPADAFDNTASYAWTIATTTNGITNFTANACVINRSAFSNDLGGGTFTLALANSGKDLQLRFGPNNPPTLTAPGNVTMNENATNAATATATDPDVPTTLTFSLVSPPSWASIDPVTGVITLAPGSGTAGDYTINVRVSDDAATPLSDNKSFAVHINGGAAPPPYSITAINVSGGTVNISWASVSGTKYQVKGSIDLLAPLATWTNVGGVVTAGGASAGQTDVLGPTQTFYRVQVVP